MNGIIDAPARPNAAGAAADSRRGDRVFLTAYVRDRATETVLREALSDVLQDDEAIRRVDLAATRKALQNEPPPRVLILDVSGEADPLRTLDDLAQYVEPGVRVLVIGDAQDMEFYRQITRTLGVMEYIAKPLNRDLVARLFKPAIAGRDASDLYLRSGRVIAVTGVRGGVGATTIAANLASYLGESTRRQTLLLDADLYGGTAALMVSAESGDALRTALEYPDRVDDVFLQRGARAVGDRMHVLSAEESLDRAADLRAEAGVRLLETLRRHYNFIVVDVPRYITPFNRVFLDAAHQRIFVMDGTLGSIRDTLRFAALPQTSSQSRSPIVVLNHAGHPGCLPRKQIISALGQTPEVIIPYSPKTLGRAAIVGEPETRRRGPLREAMITLSREITVSAAVHMKTEKRSLMARLLRR